MFDDPDVNRKEELDREFKKGAREARDESLVNELTHDVGDALIRLVVPKSWIPDETRAREAGYHQTKRGEYDPGKKTGERGQSDPSEPSSASVQDWGRYGGGGVSTSGPAARIKEAWQPAARIFRWVAAPIVWLAAGFVDSRIWLALFRETPQLEHDFGVAIGSFVLMTVVPIALAWWTWRCLSR